MFINATQKANPTPVITLTHEELAHMERNGVIGALCGVTVKSCINTDSQFIKSLLKQPLSSRIVEQLSPAEVSKLNGFASLYDILGGGIGGLVDGKRAQDLMGATTYDQFRKLL